MKIDDIKLPIDWQELIGGLVDDGQHFIVHDLVLQDALKDAGYATTSVFRRGAIEATDKLREWWKIHKNDRPETHPSTFEAAWAKRYEGKLSGSGVAIELAFKEVGKAMWDAAQFAGRDID